jgi:hypothetical protein
VQSTTIMDRLVLGAGLAPEEIAVAANWLPAVTAAADAEGRVFAYYRSLAELLIEWATDVVQDWVRARESFSRVITHLLAQRDKKIRDRVRRGALDHVDAMARADQILLGRLSAIGYVARPPLSREVTSDPARIGVEVLADRCGEYVATLALKVQAEPLDADQMERIMKTIATLRRAMVLIERTLTPRMQPVVAAVIVKDTAA